MNRMAKPSSLRIGSFSDELHVLDGLAFVDPETPALRGHVKSELPSTKRFVWDRILVQQEMTIEEYPTQLMVWWIFRRRVERIDPILNPVCVTICFVHTDRC